jgi:hypothetical protein
MSPAVMEPAHPFLPMPDASCSWLRHSKVDLVPSAAVDIVVDVSHPAAVIESPQDWSRPKYLPSVQLTIIKLLVEHHLAGQVQPGPNNDLMTLALVNEYHNLADVLLSRPRYVEGPALWAAGEGCMGWSALPWHGRLLAVLSPAPQIMI